MAAATISFQKEKPLLFRENIVEEFIKGCMNLDVKKLEKLVQDETCFSKGNQQNFLIELKTFFNILNDKGVTELKPSVALCDLCFFKEILVSFSTPEGIGAFVLSCNNDEGFVTDITLHDYFLT